jgi:SPP1 family predicted phage head-tail adaptor
VIEEATEVDAFGGPTQTWATYKETRGQIKPIRGREYFDNAAVQGEVTHKVTLRYVKGVTPKMRIKYDGRTFEITSVINIEEANRVLELMCKEAA